MRIHYPHSLRKNVRLLGLSALCLSFSFFVGMHSAGTVRPISLIEAGGTPMKGDFNSDGMIDLQDVVTVLEIVQGYRTATALDYKADPNDDGLITVDDALRLLSTISLR